MVDFRVTLYDGSYHDVDSNDLSFQMAGRIAFRKEAMAQGDAYAARAFNVGSRLRCPDQIRGINHGRFG